MCTLHVCSEWNGNGCTWRTGCHWISTETRLQVWPRPRLYSGSEGVTPELTAGQPTNQRGEVTPTRSPSLVTGMRETNKGCASQHSETSGQCAQCPGKTCLTALTSWRVIYLFPDSFRYFKRWQIIRDIVYQNRNTKGEKLPIKKLETGLSSRNAGNCFLRC